MVDVNDYRLGLAAKMGATRAVNVGREKLKDVMADLRMTEGFDVGMEMSGVPDGGATSRYRDGRRGIAGCGVANLLIDALVDCWSAGDALDTGFSASSASTCASGTTSP